MSLSRWDIGNTSPCNCGAPCALDLFPNLVCINDPNFPGGAQSIVLTRPNITANWYGSYTYSFPACASSGCAASIVTLTYVIYPNGYLGGANGCLAINYAVGGAGCPNDTGSIGSFNVVSLTDTSWQCTPPYSFSWTLSVAQDLGAGRRLYCAAGPWSWTGVATAIPSTLYATHSVFGALTLTYNASGSLGAGWYDTLSYAYPACGACPAGTVTVICFLTAGGPGLVYSDHWHALSSAGNCPNDSGAAKTATFQTGQVTCPPALSIPASITPSTTAAQALYCTTGAVTVIITP
ncbi:MAG: hypothetical protein ACLP9L_22185 [Thermoguttaceae bacterium]